MAEKTGNTLKLIVVTPYKNFYEGRSESVTLPALDGEIGIMPGHTPLVLALKPGVAMSRNGEEVIHFTVSEGYAEIGHHMILIICNSAEFPEDINLRRVCESYKDSYESLMAAKAVEDPDARSVALKELEQEAGRAAARRHLIELYGTDHQKERFMQLREEYDWT